MHRWRKKNILSLPSPCRLPPLFWVPFLDGYCTVQGLLDWVEVDLGFPELVLFRLICVFCVFLFSTPSLYPPVLFGRPVSPESLLSSAFVLGTGWQRLRQCLNLQVILCKKATNSGLFCGKWPMKIRHPMTLRHPVPWLCRDFTGLLDWFEVDLSACQAFSFRVICVRLPMFIICYALLPLCYCPRRLPPH